MCGGVTTFHLTEISPSTGSLGKIWAQAKSGIGNRKNRETSSPPHQIIEATNEAQTLFGAPCPADCACWTAGRLDGWIARYLTQPYVLALVAPPGEPGA